jgi:hypothetical protein
LNKSKNKGISTENSKLATLVATSIFTVLLTSATNPQNEFNDTSVQESVISSVEAHTCGQCNGPKKTWQV